MAVGDCSGGQVKGLAIHINGAFVSVIRTAASDRCSVISDMSDASPISGHQLHHMASPCILVTQQTLGRFVDFGIAREVHNIQTPQAIGPPSLSTVAR